MRVSDALRLSAAAFVAVTMFGAAQTAQAGGFAVREQSTTSQGMSFAGSAANNTLSAMYWNPAAVANLDGFNSENHAAIVLGDSEITVTDGTVLNGVPTDVPVAPFNLIDVNAAATGNNSGNIAKPALVPSSYYNYQLRNIDPNLYVGFSTNAPFGLVTEPENNSYRGSLIGRTAKVFNIVGTPTIGYKVAPWLTVGGGIQVGYLDARFKFGQAGTPNVFYEGDDIGVGWTLGAMFEPVKGTRIGIGYRSQVTYDLEGDFGDNVGNKFTADAELTTPDILTVSLQQRVTDRLRFMATFEWTDWSDFDQVDITATQSNAAIATNNPVIVGTTNVGSTLGPAVAGQTYASLVADWEDGWFVSAGLEYDMSPALTVRGGIAYEKSPIREATQRLTAVPDNDRIWLSAGLSYKFGQLLPAALLGPSTSTLDFAYTHIFVEDGDINRESIANPAVTLIGEAESSVDIVSFAIRTRF